MLNKLGTLFGCRLELRCVANALGVNVLQAPDSTDVRLGDPEFLGSGGGFGLVGLGRGPGQDLGFSGESDGRRLRGWTTSW
jgi:hypothetical protein